MRAALLVLLVALLGAFPAAASAAELTLRIDPPEGAVFGEELVLRGVLTQAGAPVPATLVVLEVRASGGTDYVRLDTATTGPDGAYVFARAFGRNVRLRVSAPGAQVFATGFVFPRARVTVDTVARNVVRITQALRGPPSAHIRGRTRFYL